MERKARTCKKKKLRITFYFWSNFHPTLSGRNFFYHTGQSSNYWINEMMVQTAGRGAQSRCSMMPYPIIHSQEWRCFQMIETYTAETAQFALRDNWHQAAQKDTIVLLNTDLQNRLQKYFRAWQLVLNPRKWKQTAWRVSKLFKNKHLSERTSTELIMPWTRGEKRLPFEILTYSMWERWEFCPNVKSSTL